MFFARCQSGIKVHISDLSATNLGGSGTQAALISSPA